VLTVHHDVMLARFPNASAAATEASITGVLHAHRSF